MVGKPEGREDVRCEAQDLPAQQPPPPAGLPPHCAGVAALSLKVVVVLLLLLLAVVLACAVLLLLHPEQAVQRGQDGRQEDERGDPVASRRPWVPQTGGPSPPPAAVGLPNPQAQTAHGRGGRPGRRGEGATGKKGRQDRADDGLAPHPSARFFRGIGKDRPERILERRRTGEEVAAHVGDQRQGPGDEEGQKGVVDLACVQ